MADLKKVFIIMGPTASGKSALGRVFATTLNTGLINADSMQIYRDLPILTASPTLEEKQAVPHHLYNFVDAQTVFDVNHWLALAAQKIQETDFPILVGGTGLYLSSLINGIAEIPDVDPDIRLAVRQMTLEEVAEQVKDCPFTDPQRMRRALEVQLSTGQTLAYFQSLPRKKFVQDVEFKTVFISPPRPLLHQRIEKRFHFMKKNGMVEEVAALLKQNPTGSVLKAIGVEAIQSFLEGKITENQMVNQIVVATRQYAKRQMTWFSHQIPADVVLSDIKEFRFSDLV